MVAPDVSDRSLQQLTSLAGRVAVVTGGGRGIGAAICRRLAEMGATIVVADIDEAGAADVARSLPGEASSVTLDVTDQQSIGDAVSSTVAATGRIDVWVNNAGVYPRIDFEALTLAQWNEVLQINLTGPLLCAQAAAPVMSLHGGVIVNVASLSAFRTAAPGLSQYIASKAGVVGLTRSLAVELGPRGIRVVAVAPCYIPEVVALARSPLGRTAVPDDVARVVAFLATDAAGFLSGITVPVDGGELAGTTADLA